MDESEFEFCSNPLQFSSDPSTRVGEEGADSTGVAQPAFPAYPASTGGDDYFSKRLYCEEMIRRYQDELLQLKKAEEESSSTTVAM